MRWVRSMGIVGPRAAIHGHSLTHDGKAQAERTVPGQNHQQLAAPVKVIRHPATHMDRVLLVNANIHAKAQLITARTGPLMSHGSWLALVALLLVVLLVILSLARAHQRGYGFASIATALSAFVFTITAFVLWFVNPFRVPDKLQILDQTTLANGGILILSQRYNGSLGEPSTITVYQRVRTNLWVGYYVDHEASYWRSGRLIPITNEAMRFYVYRGGKAVVKINCIDFTSALCQDPRVVGKAFLIRQDPLTIPSKRPEYLGEFLPNGDQASLLTQ